VYGHVVDRGYTKGWTPKQFLARNIHKLQEELAEASDLVDNHNDFAWLSTERIQSAGKACRTMFKEGRYDDDIITVHNIDDLKSELADVQVVLYCLAQAVEQITGEEFDVALEAVRKSAKDISRGVRK
jgi:NTP pyrophosphatase (non-canonical NTP hydrolase)